MAWGRPGSAPGRTACWCAPTPKPEQWSKRPGEPTDRSRRSACSAAICAARSAGGATKRGSAARTRCDCPVDLGIGAHRRPPALVRRPSRGPAVVVAGRGVRRDERRVARAVRRRAPGPPRRRPARHARRPAVVRRPAQGPPPAPVGNARAASGDRRTPDPVDPVRVRPSARHLARRPSASAGPGRCPSASSPTPSPAWSDSTQ